MYAIFGCLFLMSAAWCMKVSNENWHDTYQRTYFGFLAGINAAFSVFCIAQGPRLI